MNPVQPINRNTLFSECMLIAALTTLAYTISRVYRCTVATPAAVALWWGMSGAISILLGRVTGGERAHALTIFDMPIVDFSALYLVNRMGYPIDLYSSYKVFSCAMPVWNVLQVIKQKGEDPRSNPSPSSQNSEDETAPLIP